MIDDERLQALWDATATCDDRVLAFGRSLAMELSPPEALLDVLVERQRQDAKWGGPEHDDGHETADFVQLIQDYAGWARVMAGMGSDDKARRRLIQVAALAVAAVESIDRRSAS